MADARSHFIVIDFISSLHDTEEHAILTDMLQCVQLPGCEKE